MKKLFCLVGLLFSISAIAGDNFNILDNTNTTISGGTISNTPISGSTGSFTTLSASSTVSGTGFSTYLASPPAIGGTAAAAGSFTTLTASSTANITGTINQNTTSADANVGLNVLSHQAIFGGNAPGPRGGFYTDATSAAIYLDDSVTATGSGFASGSDYAGISRDNSTGNLTISNAKNGGQIKFRVGTSGTTDIMQLTSGAITINGTINAQGGSTNKAVCWKSTGVMGYCSTVVAADGSCTCN